MLSAYETSIARLGPFQGGSVAGNQLQGCLKVGLLPNWQKVYSLSEQDFGLCYVEVICEIKSKEVKNAQNKIFFAEGLSW